MKYILTASAFFAILLSSCQKDFTIEGDILPVTPTSDSTLLGMYVVLDSSGPAAMDTILKMSFLYDNAKRNTEINFDVFDTGISPLKLKSTFFYNGMDTVPFKQVCVTPYLAVTDAEYYNAVSYYFYNNDFLSQDSTVETGVYPTTLVRKYNYNNSRVVTDISLYEPLPAGLQKESDTIYLKYVNSNITSVIDSNSQITNYTCRYVYDALPNPFFKTQSKFVIGSSYPYYYVESEIPRFFTKNNVIELEETIIPFYFSFYRNVYAYKPNGYPASVKIYNQVDLTDIRKGIYFYTK